MIKLREVINRTGLSRSSVYRKMDEKTFPMSVQLGYKAVGWVEGEVSQWIEDRIAERDLQVVESLESTTR
ncbi:AlpA family transcriptional regulator [uncultured Amphritea sp.]|uniref:AlpA family transcriptional regulator n=1 Tax=uncultured Amphritea sp. TaxID=981605 RepID=UPI00260A1522|nr:AlpA family transcriptional regulator [uncultured Amphritea sp.]